MTVYDSKLTSFLGQGPAASQPATLNLHPSVFGLYHAKDTGVTNLWDGTTWTALTGGGGGSLTSKEVTDALGYTPYSAANPAGYQTAAQVTAALGPYALITSIPVGSSASPLMDGVAAAGSGTTFSFGNHVHPVDTSRYAASNPSGYQTAAQVTTALVPYAPIKDAVFTGTTTLPGSPSLDLHASTKLYVDQAVATVATAGITTLNYNVIANTAAADPGPGNIRFNTTQQYEATLLYIDSRAIDNTDWSLFMKAQAVGTKIVIQNKTDSTKVCRFLTTGAITDNTGWLTIPVTFSGAGGYMGMPFAGGTNVVVAFLSTANAQFLPIGGGTLTGDLFLPATTPTVSTQAATKKYVDDTAAIETYTLPTASTSVLGGVKVDGTTVTIASGVISAVAGGAGTVTKVSTSGTGISGGPITTAGTLSVQWNGGAVSSLGTGLSLTTGVLDAVVPVGSSTAPLMDGVAAAGSGTKFSKDDHIHPVDTSRYAATNPSGYQTAANVTSTLAPYALTSAVPTVATTDPVMDGIVNKGTLATYARADHIHASDTSRYAASNPSGYQTAAQVSSSITAAAYVLPTASTSVLGGVKVDGTTVVIAGGVISAAGGGGGAPSGPAGGDLSGAYPNPTVDKVGGVAGPFLPTSGGMMTGPLVMDDDITNPAGSDLDLNTQSNSFANGDSNWINLETGAVTSGGSGYVSLRTGDASTTIGTSGGMLLNTGHTFATGTTGLVSIGSGNAKGTGVSGEIYLYTGYATAGTSGGVSVYSGVSTAGTSGPVTLYSGTASGAGKKSGDITLTTGAVTSGATQGTIKLNSAVTAASSLSVAGTVSGAGFTTLLANYALTSSLPVASSTNPIMDGTVAIGALTTYARADHIHASDTTRQTSAQVVAAIAAGNPGAFSTLSASSTVSGTGFTNYMASPPAIGATTPSTGAFTTLNASSTVGGSGFTAYMASPPTIGGTSPAAGNFTSLSATGFVSGAGFDAYMASPPSIGGTLARSGAFSTLSANSTVSGAGFTTLLSPYALTSAIPAASSTTPLVASGAGAVGVGTTFARADHVHPAGGAQPYTVGVYVPGVLTASQVIVVHQVGVAVTFPANLGATATGGSSRCGSLINATASTTLTVAKCLAANDPTNTANFSAIGTLVFGAGGHAGTLATTGGTSQALAAGDFLRVIGPSSADATLANVFITLIADR